MFAELFSQLTEQGYQGRIVSIKRLADLQLEIEGRHRQGMLDPELYEAYLTEFAFCPPDTLPEARSIIVVAVPQPRIQVTFRWNGESVRAIIPPTYGERKKDRRVREVLAQALEPAGYRIAEARLPRKLLATRSGLATYGKNNITYVSGLGSFHGLVAVYSDVPVSEDHWQEAKMMERCENCSACRRHCPTGAIAAYRFLLHAERCITFHNEKPADVPFPAWLDPAWHNCLVGCLLCQRVCPENREVWPWVEEAAEFSAEETASLLEGRPFDQLPEGTAEKLERLDLEWYAGHLTRNLKALLAQKPSLKG